MGRNIRSWAGLMTIILVMLISIPGVYAINVSLYGTGTGFIPGSHADVVVVRSIPGSAGAELDTTVDQFTGPAVDVMILGGEDSFAPATAAKIEAAVAEGKILIITYPTNRLFDTSLPASNGGAAPGGQYLEVTTPSSALSKQIFSNLSTRFELQGTAPEKEQAVGKESSVPVLNFDTGMPALVYGRFGRGYVIEWTTTPVPSYMSAENADTILYRLITYLRPEPVSATTPRATLPQAVNATIIPTTATPLSTPTQSASSTDTTGTVVVYSSPLGASILIDGVYYGTSPANLTGIREGNHIIRLTQTGYYDYEGSLYVLPGQTTHAFGTLPPLNQYSVLQPTATAVTAVPTTAKPSGLLENSSVVVALIGVITALIAAGASVFVHITKKRD